jgi:hypothetical protein
VNVQPDLRVPNAQNAMIAVVVDVIAMNVVAVLNIASHIASVQQLLLMVNS